MCRRSARSRVFGARSGPISEVIRPNALRLMVFRSVLVGFSIGIYAAGVVHGLAATGYAAEIVVSAIGNNEGVTAELDGCTGARNPA